MHLRGLLNGGGGGSDGIALWLRDGVLHRVGGETHKLFGCLELTVFTAQTFQFQPERAPRHAGEAAAELRTKRTADYTAQSATGQGQRLFGSRLEDASDRLANRRLHHLTDSAAG